MIKLAKRITNWVLVVLLGAVILSPVGGAVEAQGKEPVSQDTVEYQEFRLRGETLGEGERANVILASGGLTLAEGAASGTFTSTIKTAPQEFDAYGPHWRAAVPPGAQLRLAARSGRDSQSMGDWIEIAPDEEMGTSAGEEVFADLVFVPEAEGVHTYLQLRVEFTRRPAGVAPTLQELTFFLTDARGGPTTADALAAEAVAAPRAAQGMSPLSLPKPSVISRSSWGCSEGQNSPRWSPRYRDTDHIIIHHTVTPNNESDYARRMRSIWSYHANSLGWGDIGYNYLVDPNGNVYEGRAGGDNVTGAHAGDYNTGTMGVSLIGTFTDYAPPAAMQNSLEALLAWKVDQRNIDPMGSSRDYRGRTYANIAPHRAVGSTACPGQKVIEKMGTIRAHVRDRIQGEEDNRWISYGQTLGGAIDPASDQDTFFFNGSAGHVVAIEMSKSGSSVDSYVRLYKPNGALLGIDDDSGGNRNSRLVRTLPDSGTYRIVAHSWEHRSTGNYNLRLIQESAGDSDDNRWLSFGRSLNGNISPRDDRDTYYFNGTRGRVVSIQMNKDGGDLDTYLELWNSSGSRIAVNDDGGSGRNSWLVHELPANGTYRIVARSWNLASSGAYQISLGAATADNLARGKYARSSSNEVWWLTPNKAVDGNMGTRWSSQFRDPGWIYVDLGRDMTFDQVVLKWETAYGREYGIYTQSTSQCNSCWTPRYYTTRGDGGTDTINFSAATARYVLMYGIRRGTPWGYSLWEFEVYNRAMTPFPIVEPDSGDKGEEAVPLVEPAAPCDLDKDVMLVGEGEFGQENMPLTSTATLSMSLDSATEYLTPTATIEAITPLTITSAITEIRFSGAAESGADNAIAEYRWYGDLVSEGEHDDDQESLPVLSYQDSFTMTVANWTPGAHVVYFQARDDAGTWSEPISMTLTVARYEVYLPVVLKSAGQ